MIVEIWADSATFRRVSFNEGFNVVTAERTRALKDRESKDKDSRNGLGKSSLIEIIHFLLGSSKLTSVKDTEVEALTFYGKFRFGREEVIVGRSMRKPQTVRIVSADVKKWETQGISVSQDSDGWFLHVYAWTDILGALAFSLPPRTEQYSPSFRSLLGYFIRRGKDAYSSPFSHYRKQHEWDIQVNNSFLIGLHWQDAKKAQELRDKGELITGLQRASELGVISDYLGKRGELEAERAQLESKTESVRNELASFTVAPQYTEIEDNADRLTAEINDLVNANFSDKLALSDYEDTLRDEITANYLDVETIYREAGAIFSPAFREDLEAARRFHDELVQNRRRFLESEIVRLRASISGRSSEIARLDRRRAGYLRALEANKALEHYSRMRLVLDELQQQMLHLNARLQTLSEIEESKAELKIESELLKLDTLQHYDECRPQRDRAAAIFRSATEQLYETPGKLIIGLAKRGGYSFSYHIDRKGSGGYSSGAVFCYDLTLAELWAGRGLNCLVHDSILFEPIDERQLAYSLELAAEASSRLGFQYICTLNTDRIPSQEFSPGFDLSKYVVLELNDAAPEDGLFGVRFSSTS